MPGSLTILRSRWLRVAVLLFQGVWLNVVVPGHQRGAVALPGDRGQPARCTADTCCPDMADDLPRDAKAPARKDPASHCAICHFAAALLAAPAIDLSPPAHEYLKSADPLPSVQAPALAVCDCYYGRAPPGLSFQLV